MKQIEKSEKIKDSLLDLSSLIDSKLDSRDGNLSHENKSIFEGVENKHIISQKNKKISNESVSQIPQNTVFDLENNFLKKVNIIYTQPNKITSKKVINPPIKISICLLYTSPSPRD